MLCHLTLFSICIVIWVTPAEAQALRYLGRQVLPHGHVVSDTTVGGLSAIDYDPVSQRHVVLSDDRSERQAARFYTLKLDLAKFNTSKHPGFDGVRFIGVTKLRNASGTPHAEGTVDPEAIRFAGDRGYWWSSEGNVQRGIPPAVEKIATDGMPLRRLHLPHYVLPGNAIGVRHNLAFESLAVWGDKLLIGIENALTQDGPVADIGQRSPARILEFDASSGKQLAEYVYMVDAVPVSPPLPGLLRTNGLVEMLAGNDMVLALERSYVMGRGNGARIYRLDLKDASNVSGRTTISGTAYTPVRKTLLLDLGALGIEVDNLEGMSWGPNLPSGRPTLILVSDNNFRGQQITRFLAFELRD